MQPTHEGRTPPGRHADEGELHVFLDGALDVMDPRRAREVREHARACPVCRDRLAVESAVRDRSVSLLASDDPLDGVPLPSLDELRRRASLGGEPSGRRRGAARFVATWAATVVLSLGVGWGVGVFGPDGLRPGAVPRPVPAAEAPVPIEPEPAGPAAPVSATPAPATPAPVERESGVPEAVAPGADAGEPAARAPEVDADPAEAAAPALDLGDLQAATPARSAPVLPALEALERRVDDRIARPDSLAAVSSALRSRSAAPPLAELRAVSGAGQAEPVARPSVDELRSVLTAQTASGADDAPADVGLVLPGLVLEDVSWTEVWPGQDGVVARQRLSDGRVVELRVAGTPVGGRVEVDPPSTWPEAPSGWNRAVRSVEGAWLVLDGPLSREALEVLLATAG